jgi:hypothetical protein
MRSETIKTLALVFGIDDYPDQCELCVAVALQSINTEMETNPGYCLKYPGQTSFLLILQGRLPLNR